MAPKQARKLTTINELATLTGQHRHTVAKQLQEQKVDLRDIWSIHAYLCVQIPRENVHGTEKGTK